MRADIPSRIVTIYQPVATGLVREVEIYPRMWRSRLLDGRRSYVGEWIQGFILFADHWPMVFRRMLTPARVDVEAYHAAGDRRREV